MNFVGFPFVACASFVYFFVIVREAYFRTATQIGVLSQDDARAIISKLTIRLIEISLIAFSTSFYHSEVLT